VDNLTTKGDLSYEHLRESLTSLSSNRQLNGYDSGNNTSSPNSNGKTSTALVVAGKGNNKNKNEKGQQAQQAQQDQKGQQAQTTGTKVYSYCKRHSGRTKGHNWQDCRTLKRDQNKKKKNANAQIAEGQSSFTYAKAFIMEVSFYLQNDGIHSWKFDTCTTSHITLDIGKSYTITLQAGVVKVGGNNFLPVEGIGSVILNTALTDGTTSNRRLDNVLYVPSLQHNLFSCIVVKSKAILLAKDNIMHIFRNNDLVHPILVIDIRDLLPWLWEATNITNTSPLAANNPNARALAAHSTYSRNLSVLVAYNSNIGSTTSLGAHNPNIGFTTLLGTHNPTMGSTSSLGALTSNMSELGAHTSNMTYNPNVDSTSSLGTCKELVF